MRRTLIILMATLVLLGGLAIQAHAQFRFNPFLDCYDWNPTVNENEPISIAARGNACIEFGNTTYTWTQTGGTPVDFEVTTWKNNWQYTQISFTAPTVSNGTSEVLTFELVLETDGYTTFGCVPVYPGTDSCNITVTVIKPANWVTVIDDSYTSVNPDSVSVYAPGTFMSNATVGGTITYTVSVGSVYPNSGLDGIVNFFGGPETVGDMFMTFSTMAGRDYKVDFSTILIGQPTTHSIFLRAIDGVGIGGTWLGSSNQIGPNDSAFFTFTASSSNTTILVRGILGSPNHSSDIALGHLKITTPNTPPVADAGDDQEIIILNDPVYPVSLDGSQSWDDDGDDITYSWTIVSKPEDSQATLSDPTAVDPTIIPDKHGDYEIQLEVSDPWNTSTPDEVVISTQNIAPVAEAGDNKSCLQGATVSFDGSGSSDENNDAITYSWRIDSKPEGSNAYLTGEDTVTTSLHTDIPGDYVVMLIVNDGLLDSEPDTATVTAISYADAFALKINEIIQTINAMPDSAFKNKQHRDNLTRKLGLILTLVTENLEYNAGYVQLENSILKKLDGCALDEIPEKNDWIVTCEHQDQVYPLVIEAMDILNSMMITCPTTLNVSYWYESDQFADVTEINMVATFTNIGPNPMKFSSSTPPDIWSVPDGLDIPIVSFSYDPADQFIAPGESFIMDLTIDVSGLDAANDKFRFWLHDVMYYGNNTTGYTTLQSVTFSCN